MEGGVLREQLRTSQIFSPDVIEDIQIKAELGRYRFRGFGTLRPRPLPSFDDLTFIPCSLTRVPLEGYREQCRTQTVLGTRYAQRPIELDIPIMITGMSFGALSYNAKVALAQGASRVGTSTTTGDGGMLPAEREHAKVLIYEVLPSRYGLNIHHLRLANGVELTVGQGAKPGTGGVLLGADAVYIGTAALIALNCNKPVYVEDYHQLGTEPYACHHCHTGRCPVGITTQDPELMQRLPIPEAAERVANLLHAMTLEIQMLARACGKADVHDLEPEDLRALTVEAAAITGIPLVGTRWVPGRDPLR